MRIFFQVHNRFGWDTTFVFVERGCLMGVALAALFYWKAVLPIAVCFVVVRMINFVFLLIVLKWKITPIKLQLNFGFMKKLQIEAFPLGLFFVILSVYAYIDTPMLSLMRDMENVGLYNSAFKIYEGISILPMMFWLVILPRLSELFKKSPEQHQRLAERSVKYMFVIGIPVMVYGAILSKFFIGTFFGAEFLPAILALQILFAGLLFHYANWMLNATLISMSRQKVILALGSMGLLLKFLLNLVLINVYGYNGAAVSTALGEFLIFAFGFGYLFMRFKGIPVFTVILKPAIAGGCAFLVFHLLKGLPMIPGLFLMGLIYIGGLFLLKTFDPLEIQVFIENTFNAKRRAL
jgi:O-antigen/teichoic acid export membrane protein